MNKNYYKSPHRVMILLKPKTGKAAFDASAHKAYYTEITGGKLINYGQAMNQRAVCVVFDVDNGNDFERIITNDPSLISGELEIGSVVPFFEIKDSML